MKLYFHCQTCLLEQDMTPLVTLARLPVIGRMLVTGRAFELIYTKTYLAVLI